VGHLSWFWSRRPAPEQNGKCLPINALTDKDICPMRIRAITTPEPRNSSGNIESQALGAGALQKGWREGFRKKSPSWLRYAWRQETHHPVARRLGNRPHLGQEMAPKGLSTRGLVIAQYTPGVKCEVCGNDSVDLHRTGTSLITYCQACGNRTETTREPKRKRWSTEERNLRLGVNHKRKS
jgi:hypothetical protein